MAPSTWASPVQGGRALLRLVESGAQDPRQLSCGVRYRMVQAFPGVLHRHRLMPSRTRLHRATFVLCARLRRTVVVPQVDLHTGDAAREVRQLFVDPLVHVLIDSVRLFNIAVVHLNYHELPVQVRGSLGWRRLHSKTFGAPVHTPSFTFRPESPEPLTLGAIRYSQSAVLEFSATAHDSESRQKSKEPDPWPGSFGLSAQSPPAQIQQPLPLKRTLRLLFERGCSWRRPKTQCHTRREPSRAVCIQGGRVRNPTR